MTEGVIGFVPARGGSKGIAAKNLSEVGGKPLVVRAVETLKAVEEIEKVVLSTDSEEIARAGKLAGAEVPFLRPKELSGDSSPVLDALHHALTFLESRGEKVRWIVMVQATSPFVKAQTVKAALRHAQEKDLPVVQSVSPVKEHPLWVRVPAGELMYPLLPHAGSLRRQDLPSLFVLNGAVNVYRADVVRSKRLPVLVGYLVIDRFEGFDIDDAFDLRIARLLAGAQE